ncbi:protein-methionine-sulfoxide reductase heme-binding subunit MsrQ [Roseovarius sp. 2305UL8-3]|uniref:protein-methionine-sulfoxide reductase heme-binding subunit MsrQ n=1 Tax=Roseovarius conchicola TaxID=3121636 RepID=UPI003527E51F
MIDALNSAFRRIPAWPIYSVSLGYAGWLLWLGIDNQLGAEPVKALEHLLGEAALYLLVAGLAITPLRRWVGLNLLKYRRAIGLACFFFVSCHLLTWAVLDVQRLNEVWADIVKRPYITVGMAAFVLMIPLAVTSNNLSLRRLGSAWRKLHKLTYLIAVLGAVHYLLLVKGWQLKPMVFLAVIVILLALRLKTPVWQARKI